MLLSSDRQVVPHELRAETGLLHADLQHIPETIPELYWHAPPSYLGDRVSGHIGLRRVPCPGRHGGSKNPQDRPSVAQDAGCGKGLAGHTPRSPLQVSSYGGTLRYELHAEIQRGDVFLPTESRPDVLLQVAAGAAGQVGAGTAEPGQWAALTKHVPTSPGQPDEHHVPGAGTLGARARAPGAAAAGGSEWSWLEPTSLRNPAWPRKGQRGQDCCAHSCWKVVREQDRAGPTLAFVVARGQRAQPLLAPHPCSQLGPVCVFTHFSRPVYPPGGALSDSCLWRHGRCRPAAGSPVFAKMSSEERF